MPNLINISKVQIDATSTPKDYPRLINQLQQNIIDAFNKLQDQVAGILDSTGYMQVSGEAIPFPATGVWGDANQVTITPGTWDITLVITGQEVGATATFDSFTAGISTSKGNNTIGMSTGDNMASFPMSAVTSQVAEGGSISAWRKTVTVATPVYAKVNCVYSAGNPIYNYRLSAVQVVQEQ